jgi:uncharacterized protein YjiS (DUF1127 family)
MSIDRKATPLFPKALEAIAAHSPQLVAVLQRIRTAREGRAAVARLCGMDDRTLQDIGINRADVDQVLAAPWDADPSIELARIRRLRMQADRQGLLRRPMN